MAGMLVGDERAEELVQLVLVDAHVALLVGDGAPASLCGAVCGSVSAASKAARRKAGPRIYIGEMLQVRLLGEVAAERDGEQVTLPPAGRLRCSRCAPGPHDRAAAALLWPGSARPAARANVRTAVWALRKAVGGDPLIASRTAVGLRPDAVTVDLADCRGRAAAGDVAAAAALCRGELLPGFAEDWAEAARRQQRTELAEVLASRSAAERDGDTGGRGALVAVALRA